ncbi:cytochrome b/b6 domain-containing protein [Luteimonas granuli]|uniref:Cytochrome B n=1 Tax=Luteimonas granuli TaxID=1176533 RepID=A0A518N3G8_9GAMM|nr:cytochrome b/b6 domain-containing protein [Luteimonas granuli]QDW66459.1 cytochrome B [Luteimonas granuli]
MNAPFPLPAVAAGRDAGTRTSTVKVWDPLLRLFHWSLAACVLGAFLVEEGDMAHRLLGYTALGLIAFRVLWGLAGPRQARFSSWVRGPRAVGTYLRERLAGRSRRQLGHNPAAAVMILVLMAGVAAVGLTGWMQTLDAYHDLEWLEELHEALAYGLLALVGVHVLAAITESLHYRENLVAAMIHGRKRALEDEGP